MSDFLTIDPSLDIPGYTRIEWVAGHAIPGEAVRLVDGVRLAGERPGAAAHRPDIVGGRDLVVAELRVDPSPERGVVLGYRFEGVEGIHDVRAFRNPEGSELVYGVLIHRDGGTWFVPVTDGGVARDARRVAPAMSRGGHYQFGLPDETLAMCGRAVADDHPTVAEFLARHEAVPTSGEYVLAPLPDGTWRLDASPCMSPASRGDVELAQAAVAKARAEPAPR